VSPVPVLNAEIAEILNRTAELLEIEGANPFRVRAYRNAARTVSGLPRGVTAMLTEGADLSGLPGIGKDMERVIAAARERNCFLEVNAQPERLDLTDAHCRLAKDMGVKVAISTDAHSIAGLDLLRFGVDQARRGWLEPDDVLNTRTWREVKRLLKRA
jgi:histidinol phosphatase-like PHP family hydrolase